MENLMKKLFIALSAISCGVNASSPAFNEYGCNANGGTCDRSELVFDRNGPNCAAMGLKSCNACFDFNGNLAADSKCQYATKLSSYISDFANVVSDPNSSWYGKYSGNNDNMLNYFKSINVSNPQQVVKDIRGGGMNYMNQAGCKLNGQCTAVNGNNYVCPTGKQKCKIHHEAQGPAHRVFPRYDSTPRSAGTEAVFANDSIL